MNGGRSFRLRAVIAYVVRAVVEGIKKPNQYQKGRSINLGGGDSPWAERLALIRKKECLWCPHREITNDVEKAGTWEVPPRDDQVPETQQSSKASPNRPQGGSDIKRKRRLGRAESLDPGERTSTKPEGTPGPVQLTAEARSGLSQDSPDSPVGKAWAVGWGSLKPGALFTRGGNFG